MVFILEGLSQKVEMKNALTNVCTTTFAQLPKRVNPLRFSERNIHVHGSHAVL